MSSGNIYMGEFKNGKANGHGVYYYAKGGIYNGDWKDDLFDGKGTYIGNHTKYEVKISFFDEIFLTLLKGRVSERKETRKGNLHYIKRQHLHW
jgi:hypothetical protein